MELTREGFVSWLKSGRLGRDVGRGNYSRQCPLAVYLGSTFLVPINIGASSFGYPDGERWMCPPWARKFIYAVDAKFGVRHVTAKAALELLGEPTEVVTPQMALVLVTVPQQPQLQKQQVQ